MGKTKIKEENIEIIEAPTEATIEEVTPVEAVIEQKAEVKAEKKEKKSKAASKKDVKRAKVRSEKYKKAVESVEKNKQYSLTEAVEQAKTSSYSKFDGTLEIHLNTSVKNIRGLVMLPFASGKKLTIIAFGKGAAESGADIIGDDAALESIAKSKINFDVIVTTPDQMSKLAKLAKVLGPRGLMPNPKNGTISTDLKKTVTELQGGKTEYKSEPKFNLIHLSLGKVNQPTEELTANAKTLIALIGKTKIKKATLSPTMGAGVKIDISSI